MAKIEGFQGDYIGLSSDQAEASRRQYGGNILVPEKPGTFWSQLISSVKEPMLLLLFVTAMIYFFLGEPRDGFIMLIFVIFISGINIFQQWRTDKTLQALKDLSSPRMRVIRNSSIEVIDSRDLTVNDLTILEEGDKIAADCILLEYHDLGVDESTLTGESDIVWKTMDAAKVDESAHWRRDRLYAGTMITQGTAICQVDRIGLQTEYGKIAQDIAGVPPSLTPLENQTRSLIRYCAVIGFLLFLLVFLISFQHTRHITDSILSGITLAMAMIPEEFPVILTVFLAMGAWRLARDNALVRRIPSVETLGSVSVLCVDKTGTLTMNQMTVQEVIPSHDCSLRDVVYWAGLACETEPFDPMEKAILEYADTQGIQRSTLFAKSLLFEFPFNSDLKMMGHVWSIDDRAQLAAKGSPESILPLCGLNNRAVETVRNFQEALALKGYRVY